MADCIDCLAPLGDDEWSVHADRGKCMANLQAAARAMSLRLADTEAALDAERTRAHELAGRFSAAQTALAGAEAERDEARARIAAAEAISPERLADAYATDGIDGVRGMLLSATAPIDPPGTMLGAPRNDVAAVLDAIRAVPVDDLLDAVDEASTGASRANDVDANIIRARLLAAGEAAAEGRTR